MTADEEHELLITVRRTSDAVRVLLTRTARMSDEQVDMKAAVAGLAGLLLAGKGGRPRPAPHDRQMVLEELATQLGEEEVFTAAELLEEPRLAAVVLHIAGRGPGSARRLGAWLGRCLGDADGLHLVLVGRRRQGRVFAVRRT